MSKKISRKDFISKTSKCAGGVICTPIILSIFQSCSKPDPISPSVDEETIYLSECPCHNAQFNQNGNVVQYPSTGEEIDPLKQYDIVSLSEDSFTVLGPNNSQLEILMSDHEPLKSIEGVSSTGPNQLDGNGLLFYRKSQNEILALSRSCTHEGCTIDPFEA